METTKTYKGFDKNLQCRGFQYEVGKTYTTDKAVACETGFHACENPLHIFNYYRPHDGTRYAVTEQSGEISKHDDDSKVASTEITIKAEIGLGDLIRAAVEYTSVKCKDAGSNYANGYSSSAAANGYSSSAAANGDRSSAAANGDWSSAAANGNRSSAAANGDSSSAAANGYSSSAAANGDRSSAAANGDWSSAAANGNWSSAAANGYSSSAAANGYSSSAAANGDRSSAAVTGEHGVAMSAGYCGKASGDEGCALFLVYRAADGSIIHAKSAIVGRDGILPRVLYTLDAAGNFVCAD